MSWRSIEMQLALPRSQDIGKLQEQLQQRGPQVQHALKEEGRMQDEVRRKQVNELELQNRVQLPSEEERPLPHTSETTNEHREEESHHPYLGKNIDYTG